MIEHPTKIFPCDCMGEGLVAAVQQEGGLDDCLGSPFIEIAFWQIGHDMIKKYSGCHGWWWRLVLAWRIFKRGMPYADMVQMNMKVAKNFAHHILYLLEKDKERKKQQDYLVKDEIVRGEIAKGVSDKIDDGVIKFLGQDMPVEPKLPALTKKMEILLSPAEEEELIEFMGEEIKTAMDNLGPYKKEEDLTYEDMAAAAIDDTLVEQLGAKKKNYHIINDGNINVEEAEIERPILSKDNLCFNHGGSGLDARINAEEGFSCPKCVEEREL